MPPTRSTKNTSGDASGDRKGRTGSSKRKDPNAPKRPSNAFFHFRSHFIKKNKAVGITGDNQADVSKVAAAVWKAMSPEATAVYEEQAKAEAEQHKKKYPDYKYNGWKGASSMASSSTPTAPPKRKSRPARRNQPASTEGAGIVITQVAQDAPRCSAEPPKYDGDSVRVYPYPQTPQALSYPATPSNFGLPTPSPSPFNSNAYTPFTSGAFVPVGIYGPSLSRVCTPSYSDVPTPSYSTIYTPSRSAAPTPSPIPLAHIPLSSPRAYYTPSPIPGNYPTPSPSAYAATPAWSAYPSTPSSDWCPTAPASPASSSRTPLTSPANSGILYLQHTPETYAVQDAWYPAQDASYSAQSSPYTAGQATYDPQAASYATYYNNHGASPSAHGAPSAAHGGSHPGQKASRSTQNASWNLRGQSCYGKEAFEEAFASSQQACAGSQQASSTVQRAASAAQGVSPTGQHASCLAQNASNAERTASCSAQITSSPAQVASGTTPPVSNALLLAQDDHTSNASLGCPAQDALQSISTYTVEHTTDSAQDASTDDPAANFDLNAYLASIGVPPPAPAQDGPHQVAIAQAMPADDANGSADPTSEPALAISAHWDEAVLLPSDENLSGLDDLFTADQYGFLEPMLLDQSALVADELFDFGYRGAILMT
ncbi:hypothetical protein EV714DRAFT_204996 [Schizophyllum commune]